MLEENLLPRKRLRSPGPEQLLQDGLGAGFALGLVGEKVGLCPNWLYAPTSFLDRIGDEVYIYDSTDQIR